MTPNYEKPPGSTRIALIPSDFSWPASVDPDERDFLLSYLEERFGIPRALFDEYLIFKNKNAWYLLRQSRFVGAVSQLKVTVVGLKAFHRINAYIKPSTGFIQIFGRFAQKAVLALNDQDLAQISSTHTLMIEKAWENGYLILSYKGRILGLGLFIENKILSQIPRQMLNHMI